MRRATILIGLLTMLAPASALAAGPVAGPPLGVVPTAGAARPAAVQGFASANQLTYHGGPVMRTNKTFAIYWVPPGFTTSTNYQSLIDGFFQNVAADNGKTTNVYSSDAQYTDTAGPIAYSSSFGGSYVDTQSFPSNGCNDGVDARCLNEQQLVNEILRVINVKSWPSGVTNEYFIFTPSGVGSCFGVGTPGCTTDQWCAYHSSFWDGAHARSFIFAVQPWADRAGCQGGSQGSPNGDSADYTINVVSHEHNEAITDPSPYNGFTSPSAWWSPINGNENGDDCAWNFGTAIGSTAFGAYNQVIGSGKYDLQGEWSNATSSCVWKFDPPAETTLPVLSGTARAGSTLTVSNGVWTGSPTGFARQWLRCAANGGSCSAIGGQTAAGYTVTPDDIGHTLRAQVTATNGAGSVSSTSAQSTLIAVPPASAILPAITGTVAVASTLTVSNGTWTGSPTTFTRQWYRCDGTGASCSPITGATGATYKPATADASHTLRAAVTATGAGGTASATSDHTAAVPGVPVTVGAPTVSGSFFLGQTLTAGSGTWNGSPSKFTYQWQRCAGTCANIAAAIAATYKLVAADVGSTVRVLVTASNASGPSTAAPSPVTGTVVGVPIDQTAPSITGSTSPGSTLTASTGTWSGSPSSYAYQWQRCTSTGTSCVNITGATSSTYLLVGADGGHKLRVSLKGTNLAGSGVAVFSPVTAVIGAT